MENFLDNFLRFVEKNKSMVGFGCGAPNVINKYIVSSLSKAKSIEVVMRDHFMGGFYSVYLIDKNVSVDITDRITQEDAKAAYDTLKSIVDGISDSNRKSFIDKFF